MNNGITREHMMFSLPPALKNDESTGALAEAAAGVLAGRLAEIDRLRIIPNVNALDEGVLDILAVDFKVDWWSADYTIGEKRATLKDSWKVHRKLGTKFALEQAISNIYPQTTVQEWWEYDGRPYCFRVMIGSFDEAADPEKLLKIRRAISQVKRLSAHLDGIDIFSALLKTRGYVGGALSPPVTVDTVPARRDVPRLRGGLAVQGRCAYLAITAVGETVRDDSFHNPCCCGGGFVLAAMDLLPAWGEHRVYDSALQLSGGAMNVTETEVLRL